MTSTKKPPRDPTDAELVEMLARRHGITLAPAGGREFDVVLPDMQLCVEITMKVHHQASKTDEIHYREIALDLLADPDQGWKDHCDCQVRSRGAYSAPGSTRSCSKPVIGVVVHKTAGTWEEGRYDATKPSYHYSFRCRTHIGKPGRDERAVVFRETFVHEAKDARKKRAAALTERARLSKMTPEERIAEDARMVRRFDDANEIARSLAKPVCGAPDGTKSRVYRKLLSDDFTWPTREIVDGRRRAAFLASEPEPEPKDPT